MLKLVCSVVAEAFDEHKDSDSLLVIERCIPCHEDEICVDGYLRDCSAVKHRAYRISPVLRVIADKILVPEGSQLPEDPPHHFREEPRSLLWRGRR